MPDETATVDAVLAYILDRVKPRAPRQVTLTDAGGLILAEPLPAREALPRFTNSAMDGFALRAEDTSAATPEAPVVLSVTTTIAAGRALPGAIAPGTCARIMTGAPLPASADAVIPFEDVTEPGPVRGVDRAIGLSHPVSPGSNVRWAGSDLAAGTRIGNAGDRLGPGQIAVLAAAGYREVSAIPRPRVAVLSTGAELAGSGGQPEPGHIRDVNGPMLMTATRLAGAEPVGLAVTGDQSVELLARLGELPAADLILTSGGVSAGDYDPLRAVFANDLSMRFWRVAMKPGRPLAFGQWRDTPLLGLPGNPVAAAVSFVVFACPLIASLAGRAVTASTIQVQAASAMVGAGARRHFVRVRLTGGPDGLPLAWPEPDQSVGRVSQLATSDALAIVPEHVPVVAAGDLLDAIPLNHDPEWMASLLRTAPAHALATSQ